MDFVVAWPHDAGTRDKSSGQYLRDLYKQHGLRMMHEQAQMLMKDGAKSNSLEGSIQSIITAERTGKLRIARSCPLYLEERRLYHRDAHGEVVKVRDDVLSAARYGVMTTRHWKCSMTAASIGSVSLARSAESTIRVEAAIRSRPLRAALTSMCSAHSRTDR